MSEQALSPPADQSALAALQQLRRIRRGNQLPIDGILAEDLVREDRDA